MPPIGQVHIDQALTNISIQYHNMMYVADQVAPPLPVEHRSNKYFIYDPGMMVRGSGKDANGKLLSLRRPGTLASEIDFTLSNDGYSTNEYALAQIVTDAAVKNADNPLQPDQDATEFLTNRVGLDNEIQVAGMVGNLSSYASANKKTLVTGAGTNPGDSSWKATTQANSDPFANFVAGRSAIRKSLFQMPNYALFSPDAVVYLSQHPLYRDRYKYVSSEGVTVQRLLQPVVFGLNTIETGAQVATSLEGQTLATGDLWISSAGNQYCLMFYRSQSDGPKTLHMMRTFDAPDDTTGARGYAVRRWRDEPRKGDMIEVAMNRDWKFIAVDGSGNNLAGYAIDGVNL